MRFSLVPLFIAVLLAVGPTTFGANTNQAAAEKIAASLGEQFPGYDIAVSYQNGKLRLAGQVASEDMVRRALDQVQKVPGVPVTDIENGLRVVQNAAPVAPPAPAQREAIVAPAPTGPVANAPVPMPSRQLPQQAAPQPPKPEVLQVSAQQPTPAPLKQPVPLAHAQTAPQYANQPQYPQPQQMQQPCSCPMHQGMQQMPQQGPMMAPPAQGAYAQEAYGPQGPMPGQYNQPNLPDYAWPSYACYPNYAEVCYPKQYSPKAWPYVGPFYPYPQAPLGWRQVTMEWHDGWWWLDFDDGSPSGPFSPLFRQPVRYTY